MRPTRITYDPEGDILYITFGDPTAATGYQLSDQILLRMDPQAKRPAGLTIFNFSIHVTTRHEIPLPGIERNRELKPALLEILGSPPVNHFLQVVKRKQGVAAILLSPTLQEALVA